MKNKSKIKSILDSAKKLISSLSFLSLEKNTCLLRTVKQQISNFKIQVVGLNGDHKILAAYARKYPVANKITEVIGQVLCKGGATER